MRTNDQEPKSKTKARVGKNLRRNPRSHLTRIASLSVSFAALIEFAIERERFVLWIMTAALLTLLGNAVVRALRSRVDSVKSDDLNAKQGLKRNIHSGIPQGGRVSEVHIGFDCDNNAADVLAD